jgi:hypothetical protein
MRVNIISYWLRTECFMLTELVVSALVAQVARVASLMALAAAGVAAHRQLPSQADPLRLPLLRPYRQPGPSLLVSVSCFFSKLLI